MQETWINPREKIWGFHVHQELSLDEFTQALVIQEHCAEYLRVHDIAIDASDAIAPGYGPHLNYMWELRVESLTEDILEKLGLAICYIAVNRFGLSAYIHPLMHDVNLSVEQALLTEGRENQANALWFSYRVPQFQQFFFEPPKDENNNLVDTRSSRVMSKNLREDLLALGKIKLAQHDFRDPSAVIIRGFHIHMDYSPEQAVLALAIFEQFNLYLWREKMYPTSTRIYAPFENGPHVLGGWEVKFETQDKQILRKIGIAIGWLICNRREMNVFIHPVTWHEGDIKEELLAHENYAFFLGVKTELDLGFFTKQITTEPG
jgi:aromatic ring-cleaving dioxygenase